MSKLYMFSTTHCTKCPEVKKALSVKDIEVEYIDAEETPELAMRYMIMSVPSIVEVSEDEVKTYWGQQQCLAFVNTL
ncbi:thioredoxin family protein [Mammaliicoccus sp. D-M17]|uniref:thioredoxin family protein n=1 Tax=Mammaliicoccus sp. D-M17 TaxID=2898677 RepID=UPI001EFA8AB0|nr:thioredoxin family protein [Mammaliicoccus sp. D-M17]